MHSSSPVDRALTFTLSTFTLTALLIGCGLSPSNNAQEPQLDLAGPALSSLALPSGVASRDIGNTSLAGSTDAARGVYTVKANGNGVGGTWDKGHFVHVPFVSNGRIVARLTSISRGSTSGTGRYGVMVRENLTPYVAGKMVTVVSGSDGTIRMYVRAAQGGNATLVKEVTGQARPLWMRVTRSGATTFTGQYSRDNVTWTTLGTVTLADMTPSAQFGLFANSGNDTALDTATFDNTEFRNENVRFDVDFTTTLRTIPSQAYGVNGFHASDPATAANPTYQANLAYMKPGNFRYHSVEIMKDSATATDGWLDTAAKTWDAAKVHSALANLNLSGSTRLINISVWPAWMDINNDKFLDAGMEDDYAALCRELVRIVNKAYTGHYIQYWEITNEYDDDYANAVPSRLGEIINIYNLAAKAMKAEDSTIKTGGLAFERADIYDNVRAFVQGTKNQSPRTLDFLSFHGYGVFEFGASTEDIYNRAYHPTDPANSGIPHHIRDLRALLSQESPNFYIPLVFDEYNITANYRVDYPDMRTHKGAVYDALSMVGSLFEGGDWTSAWNEKDGIYGKMDNSYNRRPAIHTFNLFNSYLRGNRVKCAQNQTVSLVCMATAQGARRSVVIINRSPSAQKLWFTFNGLSQTSFNRYEIASQTTGAGGPTASTVSRSTLETFIIVPADSVTVLTAN